MLLTNFEVSPEQEMDNAIVVVADHGSDRIAGFISRETIDDYFAQISLTDKQRRELIADNLNAIAAIITRKYARNEITDYNRFGSTLKRVDISYNDLRDTALRQTP